MKKIAAIILSLFSATSLAKDNSFTTNFVNEVQKAADGSGQLSEQVVVECPSPSASGTFLITHATYDFGKSLGVYVFKGGAGPDARLSWIGAKFKNDDLSSNVIVGYDFGFTLPGGQFFLTVMKSGKIKAGVNKNGTSGVKEINCKVIMPD
ncbi:MULTISPECIES: hypothetical protein [Enterobacterales]|uniref:hypothetical protein n=1 Tax=Enterobacterales TaxID=91347 RepID=UPI0013C36079|nr:MULTISPECIES: hypothetical protein [Enterobacterales]MDN2605051.1 hypothetical protein [Klebsiella variicola]MDU4746127.1 hypothetical protein [Pantoea sp.]MCS5749525.1 hypothetical protein [Klebsiella quasipneumoniae subsp. quasipneumoniae]MCY0498097.1 hypothetical protein [Klebsiella pneumoniae]MCY4740802.1 hypothetical protein [Klebsiella pneumoniae]